MKPRCHYHYYFNKIIATLLLVLSFTKFHIYSIKEQRKYTQHLYIKLIIISFQFITINSLIAQISKNQWIDLNNSGDTTKKGYTFIKDYLSNCDINTLSQGFDFDYGYNCKRPGDICVMMKERVYCDSSLLNLLALYDPIHPVQCYLTGSPKSGYTSPYSGGMINQSRAANDFHRFGFFEASINTPAHRNIFPAFWLFGDSGGAQGYNEIDIMEHGVGDVVVHSDFEGLDAEGKERIGRGKWDYCIPGQTFSDNYVVYGLKWDKNKIVWYINNKPVKVVTDIEGLNGIEENHPIADKPMWIILNNQISKKVGYIDYLPNRDSSIMKVKYIKYWQRTDSLDGNVDFTINEQKSSDPLNPIVIQKQDHCTKVKLDLTKSYLPFHNFFAKLEYFYNCDYNSDPLVFEKWIKPPLSNDTDCRTNSFLLENIYEFNLDEIFDCEDWDIDTSYCFRLTIGCLSKGCHNFCQEYEEHCNSEEYGNFETNYFKFSSCSRKVEFKLNGQSTTCNDAGQSVTCLNPINISDNHGRSRLIMDISGTQTCDNDYFVSIEKSDSLGGRTYMEKIKWLNDSEKVFLPYIDLDSLWILPNLDNDDSYCLEAGAYYRVKLATGSGNNWFEKIQLVKIAECNVNSHFMLNGSNNDTLEVSLGDPIIMDATQSKFCSSKYRIDIKDVNSTDSTFADIDVVSSNWNDPGKNIPGKLEFKYHQGDLDLYDEVIKWDPSFHFKCSKYYRVFLRIIDICKGDTSIFLTK